MPDIDWQAQADLVRSGDLSREQVKAATSFQLAQLGSSKYMDLYPDTFTFKPRIPVTWRRGWEQEQRLQAYGNLLRQFTGPESGFIRWIIQKKMQGEQYKLSVLRGLSAARRPEYEPPPVPDWMQQYIQPIEREPIEFRGRVQKPTGPTGTLTPLGPQTKLDPTQMAEMAGYLAWQKAGAPTEYSPTAIKGMADIERWWTPFVVESQAMFPRTPRKPRWATATQR